MFFEMLVVECEFELRVVSMTRPKKTSDVVGPCASSLLSGTLISVHTLLNVSTSISLGLCQTYQQK